MKIVFFKHLGCWSAKLKREERKKLNLIPLLITAFCAYPQVFFFRLGTTERHQGACIA